jgi:hypothetical protein
MFFYCGNYQGVPETRFFGDGAKEVSGVERRERALKRAVGKDLNVVVLRKIVKQLI